MLGLWDGPAWGPARSLAVDRFRPEGTDHRPITRCKLLYDGTCIYCLFRVLDRYVRCTRTGFGGEVWEDSCVELFVQPGPATGYFNFELNCGGAIYAAHVTDPTRADGRVSGEDRLLPEEGERVRVYHNMPPLVEPEIGESTTWVLECAIPFALLERYVGPLGTVAGQEWRANLYKCGDRTSHPHWAAWSPLTARNFHAPQDFGSLRFSA